MGLNCCSGVCPSVKVFRPNGWGWELDTRLWLSSSSGRRCIFPPENLWGAAPFHSGCYIIIVNFIKTKQKAANNDDLLKGSIIDDAVKDFQSQLNLHLETLFEDVQNRLFTTLPRREVTICLQLAENEDHYLPLREALRDLYNLQNYFCSQYRWLSEHFPQITDSCIIHFLL